jgi:hypothetical protein
MNVKVCPSSSKELCQCKHSDYSPEYIKKHGRYSWDTEENIGYIPIQLTLDNNERITTKKWNSSDSEEILRKIYELERFLQKKCKEIIEYAVGNGTHIYTPLIQNYKKLFENKFQENPEKSLKLRNITPDFIHQCLILFTETKHSFQELDPNDPNFMAVNKPKNTNYSSDRISIGADQKLRSFKRHIVIKTNSNEQQTLCLLIHELAHTPPNHVCFRPDDHNHDFRIFQALFLQIAKKNGFIKKVIFV